MLYLAGLILVSSGMNIDSLTAMLHVETGMAYLEQGLADRAVNEFTLALEISDSALEAYLGLGRAAAINGSWDTAEENYSVYMEYCPWDPRAPLEMANILLDLPARRGDALDYADQALSLAPMDGNCWLAVADGEAARGNTEEAIIWYTRTIVENPELALSARVKFGALLYNLGDLAQAREILLPGITAESAETNRLLALIYLEQNDDLRARDCINRYLFLEPNGTWADSARMHLEQLSFETTPGFQGE